MRTVLATITFGIGFALLCPANAQTTVGNATTTPVTPGVTEQYGVTSPFSSHQRLGNSTGIGGSYLGTESVTSETRARVSEHIIGDAAPTVHEARIQLPTGIEMPTISPGLKDPSLMSIDGRSSMTANFQLHNQSIPNFSFQNRQNPALQEVRFGGSDYSLGQFK